IRTPQLTEQYGQVERVSVARAILSSLSCATAGVRSNPRREIPAPPASALLRKVLRESSIVHPPTALIANLDQKFRRHPNSPKNIVPLLGPGQIEFTSPRPLGRTSRPMQLPAAIRSPIIA